MSYTGYPCRRLLSGDVTGSYACDRFSLVIERKLPKRISFVAMFLYHTSTKSPVDKGWQILFLCIQVSLDHPPVLLPRFVHFILC